MSRWLEDDGFGGHREVLADIEECRYLINEVCCNDKSEQCCDFPHHEYCAYRCPHFTKEEGLLADQCIACK